ncbi:DUF551 domain-containing protein [Escherichia coli]|nr:DUF551 domain-containing protein [Escherichia coli]
MSTITKERIELFIKSPLENGLTRGEQMELARIALASLEAEKVTLYRERNPYNGMTTGWQELTEQEYEFVKDNASENAEFRTVYTAPPAPVIQADVAQAIENLKQKSVECNRYNYCADAVKGVEDACLAAMRHGPEPVSQTYKLPPLSSNEVNDAAWKLHNMLTEHGPLNGRQFNNLKGCFYEALKVAMRNSPVTPDGWISCSERMPEKGQDVLISVNFDSSLVEPLICSARYTGSTFRRGDATIKPGNGIEQATHWMPLPEPPQEVNGG